MLCQLSYVGPVPITDPPRWMSFVVGREGIEPPQSKTADLQSAELTTCSTYPLMETAPDRGLRPRGGSGHRWTYAGADDGTRTRNRRFTKPLLYQLSYVGATGRAIPQDDPFGAER